FDGQAARDLPVPIRACHSPDRVSYAPSALRDRPGSRHCRSLARASVDPGNDWFRLLAPASRECQFSPTRRFSQPSDTFHPASLEAPSNPLPQSTSVRRPARTTKVLPDFYFSTSRRGRNSVPTLSSKDRFQSYARHFAFLQAYLLECRELGRRRAG